MLGLDAVCTMAGLLRIQALANHKLAIDVDLQSFVEARLELERRALDPARRQRAIRERGGRREWAARPGPG